MYTPDFGAIKAPFPETFIQKEIVNYINIKGVEIDNMIYKTQRELELFLEYRARLIADVVTGKVEVRNIRVPEFDMENGIEGIADTVEAEIDMEEEIMTTE